VSIGLPPFSTHAGETRTSGIGNRVKVRRLHAGRGPQTEENGVRPSPVDGAVFVSEPPTARKPANSRVKRSQRTAELLLAAHATDEPELRTQLLDEVVVINRCVAEAVANRYGGRGIPLEDLQQSAYEGLVKAVHKFDPTVRPDLLTYAVPTIRGEIQRWFRDQGWMVRPPRRIQELQWRVNRSIETLSKNMGRSPSEEELSRDVGCSVPELRETTQALGCFRPTSLDRPMGDGLDLTLGDLLVSTGDDWPAADARVALASVLPGLPERDRTILHLRFFDELSQSDIGDRLGVTQIQVSRLLKRILGTLRAQMA
jgi:RNA polymerase sigma-B factor